MVYEGTTTWMWDDVGRLVITAVGFDADAENDTFDLADILPSSVAQGAPWKAKDMMSFTDANLQLSATHATEVTDTVSFKVQGSIEGVTYADITGLAITDVDAADAGTTAGSATPVNATQWTSSFFRYYKFVCTTVGSGNTLTATLTLW